MLGPNISGRSSQKWRQTTPAVALTGPFYAETGDAGQSVIGNSHIADRTMLQEKFQTSRANSLYGGSSTVQPPAYTCQYLIKN